MTQLRNLSIRRILAGVCPRTASDAAGMSSLSGTHKRRRGADDEGILATGAEDTQVTRPSKQSRTEKSPVAASVLPAAHGRPMRRAATAATAAVAEQLAAE